MKNYWLILNPDTFIWVKAKEGLVYNTKNYKLVHFNNEGLIEKLVEELLQIDNLYAVTLDNLQLSNQIIRKWVDDLLAIECASLIEDNGITSRPVSLKPQLKVQDSIEYYKTKHRKKSGIQILSNLHTLIFHINGSKFGNEIYQRQIIYPGVDKKELSLRDIRNFIMSYEDFYLLPKITLVGCLWQYSDAASLLSFLKSLDITISIYCTKTDFINHKHHIKPDDKVSYHILISDYTTECSELFDKLEDNCNLYYDFIIASEKDCECANELIERYHISDVSRLYPIYTKDNLSFLESNLYIEKTDLVNIRLSKRQIFAHQVLNTNFFGTLTVFPDGKVYAGDMRSEIGTIQEELYTLVYREITEGHSWFYTRTQKPCLECIYQELCPSPSVYEWEIGKPNLCHIK
ncbi:TIGR04150 pseudo-rSAM protein [Parabacteroides pacaensis]|uniref:TIGR04150 pseudo-rSAM protein n=1 Tax=Parabacteroides pacaensis TaxID=2086575 RepID=UPI000D113A6E|nr:TIGR04150 pseudo-rSAM protein [Parabacteroides pacaensis]